MKNEMENMVMELMNHSFKNEGVNAKTVETAKAYINRKFKKYPKEEKLKARKFFYDNIDFFIDQYDYLKYGKERTFDNAIEPETEVGYKYYPDGKAEYSERVAWMAIRKYAAYDVFCSAIGNSDKRLALETIKYFDMNLYNSIKFAKQKKFDLQTFDLKEIVRLYNDDPEVVNKVPNKLCEEFKNYKPYWFVNGMKKRLAALQPLPERKILREEEEIDKISDELYAEKGISLDLFSQLPEERGLDELIMDSFFGGYEAFDQKVKEILEERIPQEVKTYNLKREKAIKFFNENIAPKVK